MKIESIRIQNFRAFQDETIPFNDYTSLVGSNGSGKSTVLNALRIFFRDTDGSPTNLTDLQKDDFHHGDTSEPIKITVTFIDLSEEAQEDFKDYFRNGKLIVAAQADYNDATKTAEVRQYGQRTGMSAFKPFFKAAGDGERVARLKELYEGIKENFQELTNPGTRQQMIDALRAYESDHQDQCEVIPSEDQFYGVSKGANRLEKHVQWILVPAVKDAAEEQVEAKNTSLGKLLLRTVRSRVAFTESITKLRDETRVEYQQILSDNKHHLNEISKSLNTKLEEWAHADASLSVEWMEDPNRSIRIDEPFAQIVAGEGEFKGEISRFGHGLQRCYLLALLQELSGCESGDGSTLILGCEEPELYQHPPQARHLASVFERLSQQYSQLIISTHSPLFVSGRGFENMRMIRKDRTTGSASVTYTTSGDVSQVIADARGEQLPSTAEGMLAKIHQELQPEINEMFFTPILVLVEGAEDVAFITSHLHLVGKWDEFRRLGCHLVPAGGKSYMIKPLAIAGKLGIPTFIVFDSDRHRLTEEPNDPHGRRTKHEKDNLTLLGLKEVNDPEAFPAETQWHDDVVMWSSEMGEIVKSDFDDDFWHECCNEASESFGQEGGLRKNSLFIAELLSRANDQGRRSASLDRLCNSILSFAENHGRPC